MYVSLLIREFFAGLSFAFRGSLAPQAVSTFKGDIIEFISCLLIAVQIVYTKRLAVSINKLNETFDPGLMIACILVGLGIYIVNRK